MTTTTNTNKNEPTFELTEAIIKAFEKGSCECGHSAIQHIYGEGACRPGFVCPCVKFKALHQPKQSGNIVRSYDQTWAQLQRMKKC